MVNFLLFCLAVIGLTNIIINSTLFEPIRKFLRSKLHPKLYELFECYQCCGTWCGFLCGGLLISKELYLIMLCGCAGSCLASTHYLLMELVISKSDSVLNLPPEDIQNLMFENKEYD